MPRTSRTNIRSAARELADAATALLASLDAFDASPFAREPTEEEAASAVLLDYARARARLSAAVGPDVPPADGESDQDTRDGDPDGGGYRV